MQVFVDYTKTHGFPSVNPQISCGFRHKSTEKHTELLGAQGETPVSKEIRGFHENSWISIKSADFQ